VNKTAADADTDPTVPLVAHIVHRFDYGGLENGLVNIINTMDRSACRHAVIALTEATAFASRITNPAATVHSLHKRPGKDPRAYLRLWSLLRQLRPAVLHTRNIGTLDCVVIGRLAGIRTCVHGEHGWDTHDPDGSNPRYRRLRKLLNPLVTRFITVSRDLADWLTGTVGIRADKVLTICNGVDTERFRPGNPRNRDGLPDGFKGPACVVIGTVTRFQDIKDPLNLVRAFIAANNKDTHNNNQDTHNNVDKKDDKKDTHLRLVMLGDGPLKPAAEALLADAGLAAQAWLPGMRDDVPDLMRQFDIFALSSKREGISNTVLEALASGLPVVATRTGGNPELVDDGATGALVTPEAPDELAAALLRYATNPGLRAAHGKAARARAEKDFSLQAMAASYQDVYAAAMNPAGS